MLFNEWEYGLICSIDYSGSIDREDIKRLYSEAQQAMLDEVIEYMEDLEKDDLYIRNDVLRNKLRKKYGGK